jgi:hypothetical protein
MQKQSKTPIIAFETKSNKWLFCSSRNNAVLSWVQTKFSTVSASPGQNYINKIQFQREKKHNSAKVPAHQSPNFRGKPAPGGPASTQSSENTHTFRGFGLLGSAVKIEL